MSASYPSRHQKKGRIHRMAELDRVERGKVGERWAARALRLSGYQILAERWRIPGGEIDIIARDHEGYAFVEVKTRTGNAFGPPQLAITPRKLDHLHRAALTWLAGHVGDASVSWRIDVVAVELTRRATPHRITIFRFFEV
jgi:putative endonuclease